MLKECDEHIKCQCLNDNHSEQSIQNEWFEEMISSLKIDQLLMQTNTIDEQKKEVYKAMMDKNDSKVHQYAREMSSRHFIYNLVESYINELVERKTELNKLAFDLLNSKVLVWAEIKDDDEYSEDSLILSAAKVNNEFYKYGIHLSPTIVEESDNIKIPDHYNQAIFK
jgi:predicted transcriptional regulator